LTFPVSESYHNEEVSWLKNFKPWVIAAIIIIIIAYVPVILDVLEGTYGGSPTYSPDNPMPLR